MNIADKVTSIIDNIVVLAMGLLTIVFVIAKIFGVISWSWLWVLSPIWILIGISLMINLLFLILAGLYSLFKIAGIFKD